MSAPPIYAARIIPHRDGTFKFDRSGEVAVIMAVNDRTGELCDYVAWLPDRPGRWWLRLGDVSPVLGAGNIELAVLCHEPITLHSTPQDWALDAGHGACILDWDVCFAEIFSGVAGVECSTPALQHRLRQAFRRWAPRITLVPQDARHAA